MVVFRDDTLERIYAHAKHDYPKECCGILLGKRLGGQRIACRIIQTQNMRGEDDTTTHFRINPLEIVRGEREAEVDGLELIGFYHSHPDHEAVASQEDILHMIVGHSYPIVSVKKGICVGINSFEKIEQTAPDAKEEEILTKEKSYAGFGIYISDPERVCKSKGQGRTGRK